jgi:N-acetylglucosamine-6-sulfatase
VKDFAAMTRAYWGTILSVDDSVGRLYDYLQKSQRLDNTLVIYMADNGLLNGEHGMVDKRTAHEPSMRIPLVMRYPKLAREPKTVAEMALTVDIAPTVLDLCGAKPLANIQGCSLTKVAQGDATGWRTSFLYAYNYEKQFPYTPNVRAVRTDGWKYMHYPPGDGSPDKHKAELYNLKEDPDEEHNLIENPEFAEQLASLQKELAKLLKETGATPDKMPLDEGIKQGLPDQKIR